MIDQQEVHNIFTLSLKFKVLPLFTPHDTQQPPGTAGLIKRASHNDFISSKNSKLIHKMPMVSHTMHIPVNTHKWFILWLC